MKRIKRQRGERNSDDSGVLGGAKRGHEKCLWRQRAKEAEVAEDFSLFSQLFAEGGS